MKDCLVVVFEPVFAGSPVFVVVSVTNEGGVRKRIHGCLCCSFPMLLIGSFH